MMGSLMQKFFELIILTSFVACSGVTKINDKVNFYQNEVEVHPGKIVQIKLPNHFKESFIKCSNSSFPVSTVGKPYFVYAESYFSDLKPKVCKAENVNINIMVKEKQFPYEELRVDRKRVSLNKKDLKRVRSEQKMLNKVYSQSMIDIIPRGNFKLPIRSKVTSEYGKRRLFNKKKKGQHLGIDFRAKVGKEIKAANDGKVVLAKNLFYTGNTVILYHGLGIFTVYGHLSQITVSENSDVRNGEIIGKAGKTGRVTGPHLHWGVKVNGQWVDGKDLLDLEFNI